MNFNINPMNFLNNMHYMGTGMISIFVVIGIIIIVTYLVNKLTSLKKQKVIVTKKGDKTSCFISLFYGLNNTIRF